MLGFNVNGCELMKQEEQERRVKIKVRCEPMKIMFCTCYIITSQTEEYTIGTGHQTNGTVLFA